MHSGLVKTMWGEMQRALNHVSGAGKGSNLRGVKRNTGRLKKVNSKIKPKMPLNPAQKGK